MATNLCMAYPDIPVKAVITYGTAPEAGATNFDCIVGPRYTTYKRSSAGTSTVFDFDLGLGVTQAANFLALARAKMLVTQDATATVKVESADAYFVPLVSTGALTISSYLEGPTGEDCCPASQMITAFATPRRFWRVTIATTASFKHEFSKLYLSTSFDMGADPSYPMEVLNEYTDKRDRRPRLVFKLNWKGITTAKVQEFRTKILNNRDLFPIYLDDIAATYHWTTLNYKLIHCWVRECDTTQVGHNRHNITATFEELT